MAPPSAKPLRRALAVIATWRRRRRSRRELMWLDPGIIRDAGIDWLDARREADKPFWRH